MAKKKIYDYTKIIRKLNNCVKQLPWQQIVNIVTSVCAIISIIIAIITVDQMKKDRAASYRPSILINPTQYEISWDEDGNFDSFDFTTDSVENNTEYNEDGTITSTITIPISVVGDGFQEFSIVNVGVGTAKNVLFEWNDSNIARLNNYLLKQDESKKDFLLVDKSAVFDYNGVLVSTNLPENTRLMYMLPEASEIYQIPLPTTYYLLIQEIIKTSDKLEEIPFLILNVSYCDVQGKKYDEYLIIYIDVMLKEENVTGGGNAKFRLAPSFDVF